MSRFNTPVAKRATRKHDSLNRESAPSFKQSDKSALVATLLTSFVKAQFYRSEKDSLKEVRELLGRVDPLFAAKAAIFARNEYGMRSITHVVGADIPARVKGESWTKNFIDKVIRRPDDATEILSLYLAEHGKPVPNSLKKGLARGLSKFDAYQLAKYRGEKKGVSLVDLVNLVHVKPTERNAEALHGLVNGTLKSEGTWEAEISKAGQATDKAEAKQEAWADLISSGKIGYFAALRNIRNVANDAPEALDALLAIVSDPKRIRKELVLPFRYVTALDAIEKESYEAKTRQKITTALNRALDASFVNTPVFDGRTLVAIDSSSSMTSNYGYGLNRGDLKRPTIEYAVVFAAALLKSNDADLMLFDSDAKYVNDINTDDSFTTILKQIRTRCRGGATNVGSVFQRANGKYDRVVILSDNESWMHRGSYYGYRGTTMAPNEAKAKYQPQAFVYAMDLAGYGDLNFSEKDRKVANIAGFSEKVFDMFKMLESDPDAMIKKIEAVEL